jgi:hypothetical protein
MSDTKVSNQSTKKTASVAVLACAGLMLIAAATLPTTVPVFAAECGTNPPSNPCTKTTTTNDEINKGLDERTTTTSELKCVKTSDPTKLQGASGECNPSNPTQTQKSTEISSECNVVAKNAHQGEGQVTGRDCAP